MFPKALEYISQAKQARMQEVYKKYQMLKQIDAENEIIRTRLIKIQKTTSSLFQAITQQPEI
jgi:Fic family protein